MLFIAAFWLSDSFTVHVFIRSGIEMACHIEMYFDAGDGFIDPI